MVAKIGPVVFSPKATPAGTQKIGAPYPLSNKNINLETTILGCVRTEVRGRGVCDCHKQLLALVVTLLRQNCSFLCVG